MKNILLFLGQLLLICLIYLVSEFVVTYLDLSIPGNVFGLIFLFVLLLTGVVKVNYIEKAAGFLNKHLAFFYIPFGVGLMNYGDLIKSNGISILVMIIGSSIIGLLVTSGSAQFLSRKAGVKRGQSDPH
jgi:holin-like protein